MNEIFKQLKSNEQRGSKPRCHLLTHGTCNEVANRLTGLIAPWGEVLPSDHWMPQGFQDVEEAQLHKARRLVAPEIGRELLDWWLATVNGNSRTPNFDIASTCIIDGQPGLLLVEAKAHDKELLNEEAGKRLSSNPTENSRANHVRIGARIAEASTRLGAEMGLKWELSRDSHYQMSNRFAWAYKLTELGLPVIIVYLGFLDAAEMQRDGRPFTTPREWAGLVREHSQPLFPAEAWNKRWTVNGRSFIPLIISTEQSLHIRESEYVV